MNLISLLEKFPNDDECREAMEELRWPAGVCCTRCGGLNVLELPKHNRWKCRSYDYQFSVMSGTIMHDSHLPLRKWFIAKSISKFTDNSLSNRTRKLATRNANRRVFTEEMFQSDINKANRLAAEWLKRYGK